MRPPGLHERDTWEWTRAGCDDCARIVDLERALQTCNAAFHSIVDRSGDGVMVIDASGRISYVNPAAEVMLGRRTEDLIGEVFGVPVAIGETAEIELLSDGVPVRVAEMCVVPTEWQAEPAYLATLRDVTERKRAEVKSQEDIRRRDVFLAMLSHELRNPLAAVANATKLLSRSNLRLETFHEARQVIERQCGHMTRLLEELLDVSRISQGKIELRKSCVALRRIVDEAVEATRGMFADRGQILDVQLPDDELYLEADSVRLHQVLVNLLSNASKYSDRGQSVLLTIERQVHEAVIGLRDKGVGMSADVLQRIFEPFAQIDSSLSRSDGGLGIGLSLVQSLVQLHGGAVTAHSDGPGTGSEFIIRLPLVPAPADEFNDEPDTHISASLRVLVVEDNSDVRNMLRSLLTLDGYEVVAVGDGFRGLEAVIEFRPQIMLVDIGLPEMDGYELARQVRTAVDGSAVHLVALTGYGQPSDRQRALDAGFDAHLSKPVDFDVLSQFLSSYAREYRKNALICLDRPTSVPRSTT